MVVHALRWPSPVHYLLWLDATLCGNCHTLHWLVIYFLWCDAQLFTATRTQCVHHQEDEVAAGNLLNAEGPEVNDTHSSKKMDNPMFLAYLTMLSQLTYKKCRRAGSLHNVTPCNNKFGSIWRYCKVLTHHFNGMYKDKDNIFRIASLWAKTQTQNLSNRKQEYYPLNWHVTLFLLIYL